MSKITGWNMADLWEAHAQRQPDAAAVIQGKHTLRWKALDDQANALATRILAAGLNHQAKVGLHLYNAPAFAVGVFAAFKAGLVPFNVNYRYGAEELRYLYDNADAEAVVFHASFAPLLERIRADLVVKLWVCVAEDGFASPDWALDFDQLVADPPPGPVAGPWGRSGDDLLFLYTGGTTGMPKAVMWPQNDWMGVLSLVPAQLGAASPEKVSDLSETLCGQPARPTRLVASPIMHGAGLGGLTGALTAAGCVALLPSQKFEAAELWAEVERLRVTRIGIVGGAFAIPMLEALDAHPGRWDLSSLETIGSTGSMWSIENKQGLLRHLPQVTLQDSFASSEAPGMGGSATVAGEPVATARFAIGANTAVFTEDGRRVAAGSDDIGLVALGAGIPLGYYKDPEKTARTFPVLEGRRWCMPGDWARVAADGALELLGRGSVCINTGGEKVFPEEVEEVVKRHPAVRDALVVGLPDARFGERICAVVEWRAGERPSASGMAAFVREHLSDYKAPRDVIAIDSLGRGPNGKADYKAIKAYAVAQAASARPLKANA